MQLLSVLEALVFSTLLFLAPSDWRLVLIFLAAASYFYFQRAFNGRRFLSSFLVLTAISFLAVSHIRTGASSLKLVLLSIFSGILFFLLLGIKNLILLHRQSLYYFLNGFLMLMILGLFFDTFASSFFVIRYLALGLAIFLLFREFLVFNFDDSLDLPNFPALARKNFISSIFSFLALQLLWGIALLPIGWLNSASLGLLFVLILEDFMIHNWNGTMTRHIILRNLTILIFLGLVIFGTSKWTL